MQEKVGIGTKIWDFLEHIGRVVVDSILGIFNIKIPDEKWNAFMQFVKFGFVGLSNTLISYGVYLVCLFAFGEEYKLVGLTLGFIVSVLNSFYWNDKYVFKKKEDEERSKIKALIKVFLSYASTGLVLSGILLVIFVDYLGIPATVAPLIGLLITIPLNYIINKVWAFKDGK
ncbi:GtrA family protein [[Clostridium] fimetarium]|uniref:Putative flippase GtrA (Transmembrane translocase of bactoprenol-linked glucose) n=1 Tax=[Clostridium] fimetarium TaxID=99656 RepID=A0A1I0P0K8_9FIRM|nr:GtrA family protein [[Clostridium] fimetarium]SEW07679.1 Putative flippase GtrA (transmembrane translocase of bactoprenol-linked glucose) [[Clostridium] fimetarium]